MILKRLALSETENSVLFDLVENEIKHAPVFGMDRDMVEIQRTLLALYDMLADFKPPKQMDDKKTTKTKTPIKKSYDSKTRRSGESDMQTS